MDRKSIIILVLCFVAFFSWQWLVNRIYPPKPLPPGSTNALSGAFTATNGNVLSNAPAQLETLSPAPQVVANISIPEEVVEVTNANAHYTFSSYGGGLKLVELLHYPETVSRHREHGTQTNRVATLNTYTPVPTLAILDGSQIQGDGVFKL